MEEEFNTGHRERLRREFLARRDEMEPYKALEYLLTYAIPRRDVRPVAKRLLQQFGSLAAVLSAAPEELTSVKGIGERSAALLLLVRALGAMYFQEEMMASELLTDPESLARFARMKIGGDSRETLMAVYCNDRMRVLGYKCYEGSLNRTFLDRRNAVDDTLRFKATAVIFVHNHPSGICEPSAEDIHLTHELAKSLALINAALVEHLIVSPRTQYSFRAAGLLTLPEARQR